MLNVLASEFLLKKENSCVTLLLKMALGIGQWADDKGGILIWQFHQKMNMLK